MNLNSNFLTNIGHSGEINTNSLGPVTFLAGSKDNNFELQTRFEATGIFNFTAINIVCDPTD